PIAKSTVAHLGPALRTAELIPSRAQRSHLELDIAAAVEARPPTITSWHFESEVAAPFETERFDADGRQQRRQTRRCRQGIRVDSISSAQRFTIQLGHRR